MPVVLYNTLTKSMEELKPLREGEIRIYMCGPTVYDYIHIGNARSFVAFDIIRRYLEYKGFKVTFLSNITDVDDKTIRRAKEMNLSLQQLGELFTNAYFEDIDKLGIKRADFNPRATQHIEEMIELIEKLIEKGYAYVVDGDVFYDVSKFEDYGKLSGNKAEALMMGARIEINPKKRNPADFALWKSRKPGEPYWHSPWGPGRPGWHIECSAMSMKYLGETFDIHAGGKDLIFPHHENEIAQSEAVTGKPLAKYWLHNEWLTINGKKMSKSLGNFITVREAIEKYGAQTLRLFLASAHYRSPIDFNERTITQARRNLERIRTSVKLFESLNESEVKLEGEDELLKGVKELKLKFEEAMDEDFNTPKAFAAIFDFLALLNRYSTTNSEVSKDTKNEVLKVLRSILEGVLGIKLTVEAREEERAVELLKVIIDLRNKFREMKDYATSDYIRDRLKEIGFILEDTKKGTRWRVL